MLRFDELKRCPYCIQDLVKTSTCHWGPFLYYVRVKGWVGGIAKYLLFLTGVGGWFCITLT